MSLLQGNGPRAVPTLLPLQRCRGRLSRMRGPQGNDGVQGLRGLWPQQACEAPRVHRTLMSPDQQPFESVTPTEP